MIAWYATLNLSWNTGSAVPTSSLESDELASLVLPVLVVSVVVLAALLPVLLEDVLLLLVLLLDDELSRPPANTSAAHRSRTAARIALIAGRGADIARVLPRRLNVNRGQIIVNGTDFVQRGVCGV